MWMWRPRIAAAPTASLGRIVLLSMTTALLGLAAVRPVRADTSPRKAVDYGAPSSWVCRPGQESVCTTGLDALVVTADGVRTPQPFSPAADPKIDCFYIYPTISQEPSPYSDMATSPEVVEVTRAQAGRLTSRCRLFAPIYRQITMAGLRQDEATGAHLDLRGPYDDVLAAWRWYMAHENHGRGVVLIGHSQGAILLQRLIAEQIDRKPAHARLVAAFLAGDPSLPVRRGALVGGAFKQTPLCVSAPQTGCVYVWGSYLSDDANTDRRFGRSPGGEMVAGCVNPAAPAGGVGELKAYLPKPQFAPDSDPPWVEVEGQLSARCVSDAEGDVLRVTVQPTRFATLLNAAFRKYGLSSGWGLHRLDLNLPQGDILDLVKAESAAWTAK